MARRSSRKIDNGCCLSYQNNYYFPKENNLLVPFKAKTNVTVIDSPLTGNKFIEIEGKVYSLAKLKENKAH